MKKHKIWNKGKVVGAKPPLSVDEINLIRGLLKQASDKRNLVLFCLAIDTSFRASDLVKLRVFDVMVSNKVLDVIRITQTKTSKPVVGLITPATRQFISEYVTASSKGAVDHLFTSNRGKSTGHITTQQYRKLVKQWLEKAGMDSAIYSTHSLRRSKISHIYKHTGNLRACQKLLGHSSIQTTANYLGIEESEAIDIARAFEI